MWGASEQRALIWDVEYVTASAGDPLPGNCELIEVGVSQLKQLSNAIDPSPFRERDLEPNAEEFIVDWAREASAGNFGLAVYLDRPAGLPNESVELREAIHEFFSHRRGTFETPAARALSPWPDEPGIGVCAPGVSFWPPEISSGNSSPGFSEKVW